MQKRKKIHIKTQRYTDVEEIKQRIESETPNPGDYLYDYKLQQEQQEVEKLGQEEFRKKYKINFCDLPISRLTQSALQKRNFVKMTEIQRCTLPHSLSGRDLMGASKTGSGKTLSYLIPIIENLYREKWTELDGLGALILCPTRELAAQVFQVLSSIIDTHDLSHGLIIGGKNYEQEKKLIHSMNILICTPGRLLQHMEESPGFDASNLKVFVIDEVDMLLEMGFKETLNAILENLPSERQTLIFSATLGKKVHEVARLSLKSPEYIFLHERQQQNKDDSNNENQKQSIKDIFEIPLKLMQYYMVVPVQEKLNTLFSFIKMHGKQKILVFLSTCKQVRFVYESFNKLKVGLPLLELHGRQKQTKRMAIFFTFQEKKYSCLFTTNLAARGLDFPQVDWVVQADCPENTEIYVHRVGRTARFKSEGKSLLLLLPSEIKFVERLKQKNYQVHKIQQNPTKKLSINNSLQAFCTEDIDLKYLAQKAFICYMRSIFFQGDKQVFDVHKIEPNDLAESLGLIQTPQIKFQKRVQLEIKTNEFDSDEEGENNDENNINNKKLSKLEKLKDKIKKKKNQKLLNSNVSVDDVAKLNDKQKLSDKSNDLEQLKKQKNVSVNHMKLVTRKNNDVLSSKYDKIRTVKNDEQADSDDDFLKLKRKHDQFDDLEKPILEVSKRQLKKIKMDGHFQGKNKIFFDQEGNTLTVDDVRMKQFDKNLKEIESSNQNFALKYSLKLEKHQNNDILNEKQRIKEKRRKRKEIMKEKEMNKHNVNQEQDVYLDNSGEDGEEGGEGSNISDQDNEQNNSESD